ncbi:MAG: sulfite exporter TauE/SafE family protein, partial [Acidobacteria bacterium]|nr:sulfite exporter TauE/SafE family protein [Acidobacteriota bacterium]
GGFLIVPALVLLAGIDTKKAVGASLGIIALNSAAGLAGQLRYATLDWTLTLEFLLAALAGMGLGARMMGSFSPAGLRKVFAWSLIAVAVVIGGSSLLQR